MDYVWGWGQVAELEQRCRDKDSEFDAYRQQLYSKPESRLQAELSMAHMEKVRGGGGGGGIRYG